MSLDLTRPGSDPLRPHQDLRIPSRIPSQYLSQVLPSSSSTPPVAVQIASLHRASEVARFEWRAVQRARQANLQRASAAAAPAPAAPPSTSDSHTAPHYETAAAAASSPSSSSSFSRPSSTMTTTSTSTIVPHSRGPSSQRITSSSMSLEAAQARDARMSSRVFSSVSEAYHSAVNDLNRHTSVGLLDVSDGEGDGDEDEEHASETSGDSTNTESEITAYSMATTPRSTRSVGVGTYRGYSSALIGSSSEDNFVAESQVWDRMVNDLAIGAGISGSSRDPVYPLANDSGPFAHQRGVSGGIATSMLALSAAIPRPESQRTSSGSHASTATASPRLLPHPIWARRYPGGAGEWLRGELARRASASSTQSVSNQTSTSIPRPAAHAPRWRNTSTTQWEDSTTSASSQSLLGTDTSIYDLFSDRNRSSGARRSSNWDWSVLRFPSLDPASRERRSRNDQAPSANVQGTDETTSLALPSSNITRSLAVPPDTRASLPTPPPPPPAAETSSSTSQSRQREEDVNTSVSSEILPVDIRATVRGDTTGAANVEAANLVARMARASRQMAASRSAISVTSGTAAEEETAAPSSSTSRATRATHGGMSYIRRLRELDGLTESQSLAVDLDAESVDSRSPPRPYEVFPWYQPPTSEAASYPLTAVESIDDEEDLSNPDPDGTNVHWYQMARERMSAQNSYVLHEVNDDPDGDRIEDEVEHGRHTLGVRRRVVAGTSGGASQRARNRSALVVADSTQDSNPTQRDIRSDSWNAVDGWTLVDQRPMSPVRRSRDEGSENVTTWLREPAQPSGRFSTSPQQMNESSSSPSLRPATTRTIHSYRPVPASDDPRTTRRPRRMASLVDSEIASYSESRVAREDTPSPESLPIEVVSNTGNNSGSVLGRARQLTSIGRRLEEEFRARQGELRQREERLRSEVARRRMELDQVRRRQGRIGRVIDRTRHQTTEVTSTNDTNEVNEEVLPLLGEQESSLIRRSALREPRRALIDSPSSSAQSEPDIAPLSTTLRGAPPTPLQEILARISLNSSRMHSGAERSLRRTSSWSASTSDNLPELLRVTSLDDHHALR